MMNRIYIALLCLICVAATRSQAQSCPDCRYTSYIFDSVDVQTVRFGEGINAQGQSQVLNMDVYQPVGDTASNRPVVIFAFGGGFIQGSRTEGYVVKACTRFAKAGFVAAAIDYRIGIDFLNIFPNPVDEMMRVFFRPMQDMRGAMQYMHAHVDSMGNSWRIDTNRIIIGGASAGAITALMVAHCDKDTEFAEIGSLSTLNALGGFYSSSGDYPQYGWRPFQTLNISGALVNASWIEPGDAPILSYHGDQDGTVPYQGGNFDLGFASIGLEGSYLVDQEATAENVCSYLYTVVGGDHPSGSMSEDELDQIFNRLLPRMRTRVQGKSYCCNMSASISPGGEIGTNPGAPLTLTANVTGSSGATVRWCSIPCDFTGTGNSITVTPQLPQHFIMVASDSSCEATDFVTAYNAVGMEDISANIPISVVPNPSLGGATVRWPQGNMPASIRIFDASGRIMEAGTASGGEFSWTADSWPAGLYLIQMQFEEETTVVRWVRQ